jgi:hypothetical protein
MNHEGMDLLDITDAVMASALTTVYGRLACLAHEASRLGSTVPARNAAAEEAVAKLMDASRTVHRYLQGMQYFPDEDGEQEDYGNVLAYIENAEDGTWESFIVDSRDA